MIPYSFDYKVADSLEEAFSLLSEAGENGALLAGGHTLIPAMKLRLSEPDTVIDISKISDLNRITKDGDTLVVGALTNHATVARSGDVMTYCRSLGEAAGVIGDPQVRNKGTIGGNIAHADPASDYPGVLLSLNTTVVAKSDSGSRSIAIDDFFTALFETALTEGEIITEIQIPVLGEGTGSAYVKFPNPASRYAVVGVGVVITLSDGKCTACRIGITGAADHAFRASVTEEVLLGSDLSTDDIEAASQHTAEGQELLSDLAASANYRVHLCSVMVKRAINIAVERAIG